MLLGSITISLFYARLLYLFIFVAPGLVRSSAAYTQVNVAVIIDGSSSVSGDDFVLEQEFAKNAVASFASRNLFDNGGKASYAQFSSSASEGGTFDNIADFNTFVDDDGQMGGGTDIIDGLAKGRELLNANPATASFLILITDGEAPDPTVRICRVSCVYR